MSRKWVKVYLDDCENLAARRVEALESIAESLRKMEPQIITIDPPKIDFAELLRSPK